MFHSDGDFLSTRYINTNAASLLTSETVLKAYDTREKERAKKAQEREARLVAAEDRCIARQKEQAKFAARRQTEAQRMKDHEAWMAKQVERQKVLNDTRLSRRQRAKYLAIYILAS